MSGQPLHPTVSPLVSIIVPNRNGEKTIGRCLKAAHASQYDNFEVIVVDDCSVDSSVTIINRFPCRLIQLPEHGGASRARNTGARHSRGELLFFIDNDCLMKPGTLAAAVAVYSKEGPGIIIGGTYTLLPYDRQFFSIFQSVYIHYSETKKPQNPDYIATHAMLIEKGPFKQSGGFNEQFLPILEDVEFSHRLKKGGTKLLMVPEIQVQHIFNFNLASSMRNGIRKSKYWSLYSMRNKDLLADSGTASLEFKFNVVSLFVVLLLVLIGSLQQSWSFLVPIPLLLGSNFYFNRRLFGFFYRARGPFFAAGALLYYVLAYPLAVGIGACSGFVSYHFGLRS